MVYDKITHLETYAGLSDDIRTGLEFLRNATPATENGVHELSPNVKAIVSEYTTKPENENGYEAHRQYIDIQYLISGSEKVACLPLEYLKETKPYDEKGDCALYRETSVRPQEVLLGTATSPSSTPRTATCPNSAQNNPLQ